MLLRRMGSQEGRNHRNEGLEQFGFAEFIAKFGKEGRKVKDVLSEAEGQQGTEP